MVMCLNYNQITKIYCYEEESVYLGSKNRLGTNVVNI